MKIKELLNYVFVITFVKIDEEYDFSHIRIKLMRQLTMSKFISYSGAKNKEHI